MRLAKGRIHRPCARRYSKSANRRNPSLVVKNGENRIGIPGIDGQEHCWNLRPLSELLIEKHIARGDTACFGAGKEHQSAGFVKPFE